MDVFELRRRLIDNYASYVRGFLQVRDPEIDRRIQHELDSGLLWPEPLIQLNPAFEPGELIDALVREGVLHPECGRIFQKDKDQAGSAGFGRPLRLHRHQAAAIRTARDGHNYVLTTGTGSGKSLAYIIPIVDHVLRRGSGRGIQAIVVYPMNALANSQHGELEKFLCHGYPAGHPPVTFAKYTGQEEQDERERILAHPPDILLTNYVMLELILTRPDEIRLVDAAQGLRFLVLDELHTYRGRQGADVALLMRRAREALNAADLQCVGTSATLAGEGIWATQQREVAAVAELVFGAPVRPDSVIGETLRRATPDRDTADAGFVRALRDRVGDPTRRPPAEYGAFVADPLSSWIESTFGVRREPGTDRLLRALPCSITGNEGAARQLSALTGVDEPRCATALQEGLLAGYEAADPETGFPAFAFRLHQFISRGDTVYASLEPEGDRYLTLEGQQYVPGDRGRVLLPLVFCRECGQEYYSVWVGEESETGRRRYRARDPFERPADDEDAAGYLYVDADGHWPTDPEGVVDRLPEDWLEEHRGRIRVKSARRKDLPRPVWLDSLGRDVGEGGDAALLAQLVRAPFRLCLRCGVEHGARQSSDFGKLATLSSEGRSTATTILSLATIRAMRRDDALRPEARKLLSFTDNRQDASLQAGHFNDFVEIGLLRAAIYRAASAAGADGLQYGELPQRVFDALDLPIGAYASDPDVRFAALEDTRRALRAVLGYRLYRDLKRGWRVTSPNLEQCGLLEIQYLSLEDLCAAEDVWAESHAALRGAAPSTRQIAAKVLLDYMRRELAIKVEDLEEVHQEAILRQSNQRLKAPWALDENEQFERATVLYPRARPAEGTAANPRALYLSRWSTFGQFLRRRSTFPDYVPGIASPETETLIADLLSALRVAGLVQVVDEPSRGEGVPGYQVPAAALLWLARDGARAFHDPLRMPSLPAEGGRTNPFFVDFYQSVAASLQGLEAHEHTAQVGREDRLERERKFRSAELPILYCTPTMELGVDIAELNAVNMRNVPPTPANYAQRSGRAGRQGQPALVFTYCSTYGPHDQYFFRRPEDMVAGAVTPPRLDLANLDLVRAHVQAIWLAETRLDLGKSLVDVLDVQGERPTLALLERVRAAMGTAVPKHRARDRAERVLATIARELESADWWHPEWLSDVLGQVGHEFDVASDRWRGLYRAACAQADAQHRIIRDASRLPTDKEQARRLRAEAEAQLALLTHDKDLMQSDFYSYRYYASEGFLPGYSFPRLPLAAYIPGRRGKTGKEEFLSRPRFLAIAEFGPRAVVYHEGARYVVNKVILPVRDEAGPADSGGVVTGEAKLCERCGYLHPVGGGEGADVCERCNALLPSSLTQLFRMQNVSTRRLDRITSDEEERQRIGYEVQTAVRFAEPGGRPTHRTATVERGGEALATLTYGHAATLWRINFGWRRRTSATPPGFLLDVERGYWARSQQEVKDDPADVPDPLSPRQIRVIPYVEDRRNCLLVEPADPLDAGEMASLQAALKTAIQTLYQLEDNELAAEPLPDRDDRRVILLYEAAEGGAGALRRLLDDEQGMARVARRALELCHFDPYTGADRRRGPRAREDCEAACYDCLMSYYNQRDHDLLDRQRIRDLLLQLAEATVVASPTPLTRASHLAYLLSQAGSNLERDWLRYLDARGHHLPSHAQTLVERCGTRPDFLYADDQAVIYVDGPHHVYPERQARDATQQDALENAGYVVIRFVHDADWDAALARYPGVFGPPRAIAGALDDSFDEDADSTDEDDGALDLDLFDPRWHPLVRALAAHDGVTIEPGGDVAGPDGRVIGQYAAEVSRHGRRLRLVDKSDPALERLVAAGRDLGASCLAVAPESSDESLRAVLKVLEVQR